MYVLMSLFDEMFTWRTCQENSYSIVCFFTTKPVLDSKNSN